MIVEDYCVLWQRERQFLIDAQLFDRTYFIVVGKNSNRYAFEARFTWYQSTTKYQSITVIVGNFTGNFSSINLGRLCFKTYS